MIQLRPFSPTLITVALLAMTAVNGVLASACKTAQRSLPPGSEQASVQITVVGAITADPEVSRYAYSLNNCLPMPASGAYGPGNVVTVTGAGIRMGLSSCQLQAATGGGSQSANVVYSGTVADLSLDLEGNLVGTVDLGSKLSGLAPPPPCSPPPPANKPAPAPALAPAPNQLPPPASPTGVAVGVTTGSCPPPQVFDTSTFTCVAPSAPSPAAKP